MKGILLVAETNQDEKPDEWTDFCSHFQVVEVDHKREPNKFLDALSRAHILWFRTSLPIDEKLLSHAKALKLILRLGSGLDHVDFEACENHQVKVLSTPDALKTTAAELTMGLILSSLRSIAEAHHSLRKGEWERKKFRGTELAGKTLGILGLGRIGKLLALRAKAFEMKVLACDPYIEKEDFAKAHAESVSFETLLTHADILSLHTPLTPETSLIINESALAKMKPSAILVNAARGRLVDESAVLTQLEKGKLAHYAADVFMEEPLPSSHAFRSNPKITMTPHLGAQTHEAQQRIWKEAMKLTLSHGE